MAVYDRMSGAVPFEQRGECPVLKRLSEMIVAFVMWEVQSRSGLEAEHCGNEPSGSGIHQIANRNRYPELLMMAMLLDQMKHETNRQIAIDLGTIGSCEECKEKCRD